jgi:alkyl hydroperoxide reductase subunit D
MDALREFAASFPDAAKDIRVNLASVLQQSALSPAQRFGVALAAAHAASNPALAAAIVAAAGDQLPAATADDALAAAALMAMNNIYYRARHMIGKGEYEALPPRLRMQRLAAPAGDRVDFELFALAVSAVHGCSTCLQAHERVVRQGGLTPDQVHDCLRIAAVVHAAAAAATMSTSSA